MAGKYTQTQLVLLRNSLALQTFLNDRPRIGELDPTRSKRLEHFFERRSA